jgi:hypothetical protein
MQFFGKHPLPPLSLKYEKIIVVFSLEPGKLMSFLRSAAERVARFCYVNEMVFLC